MERGLTGVRGDLAQPRPRPRAPMCCAPYRKSAPMHFLVLFFLLLWATPVHPDLAQGSAVAWLSFEGTPSAGAAAIFSGTLLTIPSLGQQPPQRAQSTDDDSFFLTEGQEIGAGGSFTSAALVGVPQGSVRTGLGVSGLGYYFDGGSSRVLVDVDVSQATAICNLWAVDAPGRP